jgi:hypothetical protein
LDFELPRDPLGPSILPTCEEVLRSYFECVFDILIPLHRRVGKTDNGVRQNGVSPTDRALVDDEDPSVRTSGAEIGNTCADDNRILRLGGGEY